MLYDYDPSRSAADPKRLLGDFSGYLQSDGYSGYDAVSAETGITQLGCWAHARRNFDEALKVQSKARKSKRKTPLAAQALQRIQLLCRIACKAKNLTAEERLALRQQQAVPVLNGLGTWLEHNLPLVPTQSALGKAMGLSAQTMAQAKHLRDRWTAAYRQQSHGESDPTVCYRPQKLFVL